MTPALGKRQVVHKYFAIQTTHQGHVWCYEKKKQGKYNTCWSEMFETFEDCSVDLEDFYKRLYSSKNEEAVITAQVVKVRLLAKINPGRRVNYVLDKIR